MKAVTPRMSVQVVHVSEVRSEYMLRAQATETANLAFRNTDGVRIGTIKRLWYSDLASCLMGDVELTESGMWELHVKRPGIPMDRSS